MKSAESWTKKQHLLLEGLRIIHFHKDLLEQYAFSVRLHESKVRVENCFSFFQSLSVPDHPCISGRANVHYLINFCPLSSPARKVDMRISKAPRCIPRMFFLQNFAWVLNLSNWCPLFSWERLLTVFNLPSWSKVTGCAAKPNAVNRLWKPSEAERHLSWPCVWWTASLRFVTILWTKRATKLANCTSDPERKLQKSTVQEWFLIFALLWTFMEEVQWKQIQRVYQQ